MEVQNMKKVLLTAGIISTLLLVGCSEDKADVQQEDQQLQQEINELKIENGKLKTENENLKKKIELMKKEQMEKEKAQ